MKTVRNLICGNWLPAVVDEEKATLSFNPTTGEPVAKFQPATERMLNDAVAAARRAFNNWRLTPAPHRGEILYKAAELLVERKQELGELVTTEMGKVIKEGLSDVQEAIDMAYYMAGEGRRLQGETVPSELKNKDAKSVREPIGVFGLITPWNFPVAIPSWKIFAALISGNTVVFKPSSDTVACAQVFVQILEEAGVPAGVLNMVVGGGSTVGDWLVRHPGIDGISFTGSCDVGFGVERLAAADRKAISTEMGGKNAVIVDNDADVEWAARGCIWGAFGTAGQRCTAASRIVVLPKVYQDFVDRFTTYMMELSVGDPFKCDVGPVINQAAKDKILEYIKHGSLQNPKAELYVNGNMDTELYKKGTFVPPSVFVGVDPDSRIGQEEIFGPQTSIIRAKNIDHAIEIVNNTKYGLSSAIFTNNVNTSARAERDLNTGLVYINAATIGAEIQLPFGGIKATGVGAREAGGRGGALDLYTKWKVVYRDWSGKIQKAQMDE
jgi:acyl-CoA reductase-like NAD-dependent aldehyde dehydrogenase